MDVLAGRKTVGRITGDVKVNGFPKEQATFAAIAGCELCNLFGACTKRNSPFVSLVMHACPMTRYEYADVEQTDIHMPRTTVREALQVSGTLRLKDTTREKCELFVDEVSNAVISAEPTKQLRLMFVCLINQNVPCSTLALAGHAPKAFINKTTVINYNQSS